MTTPRVSVIVAAYDAERFLATAVESVLAQTCADLEVIVVDDGSADGTARLAKELEVRDPRVRLVRKPNGGLSSARNAGMSAARGGYLCFLDADDVLLPDKLERQLAFLERSPECDLVYSDHYLGDERLAPLALECRRPPDVPFAELLSYCNWFAPMSPLVRRRLVDRVGHFDEALSSAEDWDYWIRASRCGVLAYLPGPVAIYRTHPGQMHHDLARMRENQARVIRKHFPPGSREWRLAHAAQDWSDAKRAHARRRHLRTAVHLLGLAWHTRSLRDLRRVVRHAY
jgi:glycosyltransferase involved in cell wall biosynthesis